jgi:tagatose 1,6-diphosphate aldolase
MDAAVGKMISLKRISDGQGRFALLAVDQRPPLYNLVAERRPGWPQALVWEEVRRLKAMVVRALGDLVTGVLLDPLYGQEAVQVLPKGVGLLLTLEDHRFREDALGFRLSRVIPRWGVSAAVRSGADALKLLVWYRPDAPPQVRAHQVDLVRRVGRVAWKYGRSLVLEILPYPRLDASTEVEGLWEGILRDFSNPRLGVDLYKLPYVPRVVRKFSEVLPAPWVLLSGGLSAEDFLESLEASLDAGARGFLAGRAFWLEALKAYPDLGEVGEGLERTRAHVEKAKKLLLKKLPPGGVA